jgi:hypothetical protein
MRLFKISRFICLVGIAIAIFPLAFLLQIELGYEVSLFPLYMLAIGILSWELGLVGAVLSVIVATSLWLGGNLLVGVVYTYEWTIYYNTGARTVVFIMVAVFILLFRRMSLRQQRLMESMRGLLDVCPGCGSFRGSSGKWIPLGQLSAPRTKAVCACPACERTFRAADASQ